MKKLIFITLLIWGCDYAPTEHTHEDAINPLVGVWEHTAYEYYKPSIDVPDYWLLNDTNSYVVGEIHPIYEDYYVNISVKWIINSNGTFILDVYNPPNNISSQESDYELEGVWSSNGSKLTLLYGDDVYDEIRLRDFEIINDELKILETDMNYTGGTYELLTKKYWIYKRFTNSL